MKKLIVTPLCLVGVCVVVGLGIHLRLGSESLSAWGEYLTGSATLILACAAILAGSLAYQDYRSKVTAEKSKWLLQLYEKLFENAHYKEVRRKMDYDETEEIKRLIHADAKGAKFTPEQQAEFDAFTDYLNFFELIARLKAIGQLSGDDIKATFDYYLKLLVRQRNPEIRGYLVKDGFENLNKILSDDYESKI
ncbi:MAG TPA: hypothetical protein VGH83_01795 [Candidatus Acidoferrum sp.]|jgi:hypothetical protein